ADGVGLFALIFAPARWAGEGRPQSARPRRDDFDALAGVADAGQRPAEGALDRLLEPGALGRAPIVGRRYDGGQVQTQPHDLTPSWPSRWSGRHTRSRRAASSARRKALRQSGLRPGNNS